VNPWEVPPPGGSFAPLRAALHRLRVALRDARHNRRGARAGRRILVLRQWTNNWNYNDHFLAWLAARAPEAARLFELRRVPARVEGWEARCALLVPWIQDPVRERFPEIYAAVRAMEETCAARGVPVVNPVGALSNAIKSVAARIIRGAGVRTAAMVRVTDPAAFRRDQGGLLPPFLVREDERHGTRMILVEDRAALARVPFDAFAAPVAVEFIDTRGADGLYRRYRYLAIGERGIPRSLRVSRSWRSTREDRIFDDATHAEEMAYLGRGDPNHDALQRARRALGLDVVAFDYGYDREGRLVVFEPNPLPNLWDPTGSATFQRYQGPLFERLYAELLAYYLRRAGLAPER
jgi:hypothetical protein